MNIWTPTQQGIIGDANPFTGTPSPRFQAVFNDLGDGIVNVIPNAPFTVPTGYARGSTAWTRLANGIWKQVAINAPRSYYGCEFGEVYSGRYDGYLHEQISINVCLYSRDLTNAVWSKASVTAVKDQVGIDGVENSASRLTATGAGGTVSQVVGAGYTVFGMFIKRLVGTGTIEITRNAGANWVDITADLAVFPIGTWSAYPLYTVAGGASSTVSIRLGTSGDSIAVDMCQAEDATFAEMTSPNPATTVPITREPDELFYSTTNLFPDPSNFTIFCNFATTFGDQQLCVPFLSEIDFINYTKLRLQPANTNCVLEKAINAGGTFVSVVTPYGVGERIKIAGRNSSIFGVDSFINGVTGTKTNNSTEPALFSAIFRIGWEVGSTPRGSFAISDFRIYASALSNEQIFKL